MFFCELCGREITSRGSKWHDKTCIKHPGLEILAADWRQGNSLAVMASKYDVSPRTVSRWLDAAKVKKFESQRIGGGVWEIIPESRIDFKADSRDRCKKCPVFKECADVFIQGFVYCEELDTGQVGYLESNGVDVAALTARARRHVE